MKTSFGIHALAMIGVATTLSACQQRQEAAPAASGEPAADVTVNPPSNVTVNPPDVNINPPDVNLNAPDVDLPSPPEGKVTRESTTVRVPGVGSTTTTTVEKK